LPEWFLRKELVAKKSLHFMLTSLRRKGRTLQRTLHIHLYSLQCFPSAGAIVGG